MMRTPIALRALGTAVAAAACMGLAAPALANTASTAKTAAKSAAGTAVKTKVAKSASRAELDSRAKGLALATATVGAITAGQLEVANRVLTGRAECEFDQSVDVQPMEGHQGAFRVGFKKATYTMVPEETTSGAVRLEDKKAQVVWLQIANKSMLMNAKIGQRMVDNCTHAEQRAAANAAAGAQASGLLKQ
jgi:hypothetical protein